MSNPNFAVPITLHILQQRELPARANETMIPFLKKIFGKQKAVNRSTPFPEEWNLTLSDLFE